MLQCLFDLVRLAIDIVPQFGKSCSFGLPEATSCAMLAGLDCLGESPKGVDAGQPSAKVCLIVETCKVSIAWRCLELHRLRSVEVQHPTANIACESAQAFTVRPTMNVSNS
jgi:hypothetical protein